MVFPKAPFLQGIKTLYWGESARDFGQSCLVKRSPFSWSHISSLCPYKSWAYTLSTTGQFLNPKFNIRVGTISHKLAAVISIGKLSTQCHTVFGDGTEANSCMAGSLLQGNNRLLVWDAAQLVFINSYNDIDSHVQSLRSSAVLCLHNLGCISALDWHCHALHQYIIHCEPSI